MEKISKKFTDRLRKNLKKYQDIVTSQRNKDVSEADTVAVIRSILTDIFGYDNFKELIAEQKIGNTKTRCDLAIKVEDKVKLLIEVKSVDSPLNEAKYLQAIHYGTDSSFSWVLLTNAVEWQIHYIKNIPHISYEPVAKFNLLTFDLKNPESIASAFMLAREGMKIDAMGTYQQRNELLNKFTIAQILMDEPCVGLIRKELRKLFPSLKVDQETITNLLANDILKRDVLEGDKVKEAQAMIKKAMRKSAKSSAVADKAKTILVNAVVSEIQKDDNSPSS